MNDVSEKQYHIGLSHEDGAKYAIIPGDPGRVPMIAEYLDNAEAVCSNREFNTYAGTLEGERVLVTSTGIGGPSAAICIEELANVGVDTIIRVGTCGGMAAKVAAGDVVIASGAIRMDGTSKEYMPIEFPAVADIDVTCALRQAAVELGAVSHTGVVHCKDSFYGQQAPRTMGTADELLYKWDAWIKAGALASEMESSTLFVVSALRGIRSGAVFSCVWNQMTAGEAMPKDRVTDTTIAIKVAVEAMRSLIRKDRV